MRKTRENEETATKEREKDRKRKEKDMEDPIKGIIIKDRRCEGMKKIRSDPLSSEKERERDRERKQRDMKDPIKGEFIKETRCDGMKNIRSNPKSAEEERERDREREQRDMKDPVKRTIMNERTFEGMKKIRSDPVAVKDEKERDRERKKRDNKDHIKGPIIKENRGKGMKKIRSNPKTAEEERERDRERKQRDMKDPVKRTIMNERTFKAMKKIRSDPLAVEEEKERDRERKRRDMKDLVKGPIIKETRCEGMKKIRSDPISADEEREKDRERKKRDMENPEKCAIIKDQRKDGMKRARLDPEKAEMMKEKDKEAKRRALADEERAVIINEQKRRSINNSRNHEKLLKEKTSNSWPPNISEEIKKLCIDEFKSMTSNNALHIEICGICGVESNDTKVLDFEEIPNKYHLEQAHYPEVIDEYKVFGHILDEAGVEDSNVTCCKQCLNSLEADKLPSLSVANGMDFGKCPPELENLTIVEKMLIGAYRTSMCVVKFKEIAGKGTEQRGLKGNCITFPQDIESITTSLKAKSLPHDVDDLPEVVKVVYIGNSPPSKKQLQNVLNVRRKKVLDALQWLKRHHKQYSSIPIDDDKMKKIPQDDIPSTVWETLHHSNEINIEQSSHQGYNSETIDNVLEGCLSEDIIDGEVVMESTGVIDINANSVTSDEQTSAAARHLIENAKRNNIKEKVTLVPHGDVPICEYNNPDMWTGGYPWLFPYGVGGPEDDRKEKLSFDKWIKHVLQHHFRRFRKEHRFFFHVHNVLKKRDVCLYTAMCVRHPKFSETSRILNDLSSKQIENIITSMANRNLTDPAAKLLLDQIHVVGSKIKGTGFDKRIYRKEIQGLMIYMGMPAFFVTINPADVHSPIVSFLAGEDIDLDAEFPAVPSARERAKIVADDPVACAKFFKTIVLAYINSLLRYGKTGGGILGNVSAYHGVVEEQGRGALHLHMMIWIDGYQSPTKLREEMKANPEYSKKVMEYLESVIKQQYPSSIIPQDTKEENQMSSTVTQDTKETGRTDEITTKAEQKTSKTNKKEMKTSRPCKITDKNENKNQKNDVDMKDDTNDNKEEILTRQPPDTKSASFAEDLKDQVEHLVKYCNIHKHCFTCHKYGEKDGCRFDYPRRLVKCSELSGEEILIKRWEHWVNNYEEVSLVCLKCNTDIKFIGSGKDCKSLVFYITDYQTKSGLTTHNTLPLVASAMKNMERGNNRRIYADADSKSQAMIYKCVNRITGEQEMSAPHVASLLLGFDERYTSHTFRVLNMLSFMSQLDESETGDRLDSQSRIESGNSGMVLLNDTTDYVMRGEELVGLSLYDYTSTIEKVTLRSEKKLKPETVGVKKGRPKNQRIHFQKGHPQSKTHIQKKRSTEVVPRLTWIPPNEQTNKEKFCLSMLILFKPFTDLNDLKYGYSTWEEAFNAHTFSEDHKNHISNIREMHQGLLQKAELDEARHLHKQDESNEMPEHEGQYYYLSDDDEDMLETEDEYYEMMMNQKVKQECVLKTSVDTVHALEIISKARRLNDPLETTKTSIDPMKKIATKKRIQEWQKDIEEKRKKAIDDMNRHEKDNHKENDDHVNTTSQKCKELNESELNDRFDNIIDNVIRMFKLNEKQEKAFKLIAQNVVNRLRGITVKQKLLYLGGGAGTGKSQVIKAVRKLHEILEIQYALKVTAFTGTAAGEVGGSTLSSLAQVSRNNSKKADLKKLEKNWEGVNTLNIDEISMVSCSFLAKLHRNLVRAKHEMPTEPFGGMDVIFVGDFAQFAPIRSTPLYYGMDKETKMKAIHSQCHVDREFGRTLWQQITHVVILTEQNRVKDTSYSEMLTRISQGEGTLNDRKLLNSRLITRVNIDEERFSTAPIVVPGNELRQALNRTQAIYQCKQGGMKLFISKSEDTCAKVKLTNSKLQQIQSLAFTKTSNLPGELELFHGAKVMLTTNIAVELNLTNGAFGEVTQIGLCRRNNYIRNGEQYILGAVPEYVIVRFEDARIPKLVGLNHGEVPIFPIKSTFQYKFPGAKKSVSISRYQLPLVTAYSYTTYKAQGKTLDAMITDLLPMSGVPVDPSFAYVALSRVRSLNDLVILREFPLEVLQAKQSSDLIAQNRKFHQMDVETFTEEENQEH